VKQEANTEVERYPGKIEQRHRPWARQERTNLIEITQRLKAISDYLALQRHAHQCIMNSEAQNLVQRAADARQDSPPDPLQQPLKRE
jgi:hypothetical protein